MCCMQFILWNDCNIQAEIQVENGVYSLYKVGHKRGPKFLSYEGPSIETLNLFCEYFSSTPNLYHFFLIFVTHLQ